LITLVGFGFTACGEDFRVTNADDFHERIKAAVPGDRIVLANGQWSDVELVADATGSPAALITIEAEQPGKVVITGNSRLRIAGSHVVVRGLRFQNAWHKSALIEFRKDSKRAASDCRLTDCELFDCNPPDPKLSSKYVSIYGLRNTVDRCRLQGKTNRGTTLVVWLGEGLGKHRIGNNHFGPRPFLGTNEGETIRIGDSNTAHLSGGCLIEGNLFEECNGETEIVSNKSRENIYRKNVFLRCSGTLTLRHGSRCRVEENSFLGEKARGSGGVRIIGSDHIVIRNYFERLEGDNYRSGLCVMNGIPNSPANGYEPVERALIAHNTFYDCKRSILIGGDNDEKSQVPPRKLIIANNAIVSRRGPLIEVRDGVGSINWQGNLCFGEGELGVNEQPGVRRCNEPPLKKIGSRWTIFEGSPLVGAGYVLHEFSDTQLSGPSPDVGCDVWPANEDSVTIADMKVGPSWSPVSLLP
jgi:poly(beta-D-mannuronate) lyase